MTAQSARRARMSGWHSALRLLPAPLTRDKLNDADDYTYWLRAVPVSGEDTARLNEALVILAMLGAVDSRGWEVQAISLWGMTGAERVKKISRHSPLVGLAIAINEERHAASLFSPRVDYSNKFQEQYADLEAAIAEQSGVTARDLRVPIRIECRIEEAGTLTNVLRLMLESITAHEGVDPSTFQTLQERMQWHARFKLQSLEFSAAAQIDIQGLSMLKDICAKGISVSIIPKLSGDYVVNDSVRREYLEVLASIYPSKPCAIAPVSTAIVSDTMPPELVPALLSTLRFSQTVSAINAELDQSSEWLWRWLAVLLTAGASHTITTINFTKPLSDIGIRVLKETLETSNPVASLLFPGEDSRSQPREQLVATRFHLVSPRSEDSTILWESDADTIVQVLHSDEDWWYVCLPRYGLAWVHRSDARVCPASGVETSLPAITDMTFVAGGTRQDAIVDLLELIGQPVTRVGVSLPRRIAQSGDNSSNNTINRGAIGIDLTWLRKILAACPSLEKLSLPSLVLLSPRCLHLVASHLRSASTQSSLTISVKQDSSSYLTSFFEMLCDNRHPFTTSLDRLVMTIRVRSQSDLSFVDAMLRMLDVNGFMTHFEITLMEVEAINWPGDHPRKSFYLYPRVKEVHSPLSDRARLALLSVLAEDSSSVRAKLDNVAVSRIIRYAGRPVTREAKLQYMDLANLSELTVHEDED